MGNEKLFSFGMNRKKSKKRRPLFAVRSRKMQKVIHTIPPVYDKNSRILILGSFPSVRSRQSGFFYGHPQNRFWRVLAAVFGEETIPADNDEKRVFLLSHKIALWDVIACCEIEGSSDSSIKNALPNDISPILDLCDISAIYTCGNTAKKLYDRYIFPLSRREACALPSTSAANAAYSLRRLTDEWRVISVQ